MRKLSGYEAEQIAAQTVQILKNGSYTDADGQHHDIAEVVQNSFASTRPFRPEWEFAPLPAPRFEAEVSVVNCTTFAACEALIQKGLKVAALNFASARSPGGGFLRGARAQEEDLCRNSTLYSCLEKHRDFYDFHARLGGALYSSYLLFSPRVSVIRDDQSRLRAPFDVAIITGAAPNLNPKWGRVPDEKTVRTAFEERIDRVFSVALEHKIEALVLGAWGCGAFRNDPKLVAPIFAAATEKYRGHFQEIVFAVLDLEPQTGNFAAFEAAFSPR